MERLVLAISPSSCVDFACGRPVSKTNQYWIAKNNKQSLSPMIGVGLPPASPPFDCFSPVFIGSRPNKGHSALFLFFFNGIYRSFESLSDVLLHAALQGENVQTKQAEAPGSVSHYCACVLKYNLTRPKT